MEEYRSEFEAPVHTVVDVRHVGNEVIRRVLIDGEIQEFVASRTLYLEGNALTASVPDVST